MLKRVIYIGTPRRISIKNKQLVLESQAPENLESIPIEDLGILILDHAQVIITQPALQSLAENNTATVICNAKHMPASVLLSMDGHTLQQKRQQWQIEAAVPLKKQLWAQTIKCKIQNQAEVLERSGIKASYLKNVAIGVKSGDSNNAEATASAWYWPRFLQRDYPFKRDHEGEAPNNALNYAYAILRAATARALVGSGLLCGLGIFHKNQYNPYCLADDIMEPYRPIVDYWVLQREKEQSFGEVLSQEDKRYLLSLMSVDVMIDGQKSPLMNALSRSSASLAQCYEGVEKKIVYPALPL